MGRLEILEIYADLKICCKTIKIVYSKNNEFLGVL